MADAVVDLDDDVWEGRDVSVDAVLHALERGRRDCGFGAVRTSVLTLVVVIGPDEEPPAVFEQVHRLGGRHPSRTIVVRTDVEGAGDGIDARVGVHGLQRADSRLALDDVVLHVHGEASRHLRSIIAPLALADLPLVVWSRAGIPEPDDALAGMADVVLVDSAAHGGVDALASVVALGERVQTIDLAWTRLLTVRERLVTLLRMPAYRPFLDDVTGAEVGGGEPARHLLAGWLLDRLGLARSRLRRRDGDEVVVAIRGAHDGRTARFEVGDDGRAVHIHAEIDGGCHTESTLARPPADPTADVARVLPDLRADSLYAAAVTAAAARHL